MEDPKSELLTCIRGIVAAPSPQAQQQTILRYYHPEAGLRHPLATVVGGPGSREKIMGVFAWYREFSPNVEIQLEKVVYDEKENVVFLYVAQKFHFFFSPLKPSAARLLVVAWLKRSEVDGRQYVIQQDDYYQPEDMMHLALPFLAPVVSYAKQGVVFLVIWMGIMAVYLKGLYATHFGQKGAGAVVKDMERPESTENWVRGQEEGADSLSQKKST